MNGARSRKREAPISHRSKIEKLKDFLEGKPLRHPIHPMLVHFPIGLLLLSFLIDLAILLSRRCRISCAIRSTRCCSD